MSNLKDHDTNYTIEKMRSKSIDFKKILVGVDFNNILNLLGKKIKITENIVNHIKELRNNYCRVEGLDGICKKKEVGGILGEDRNNQEGSLVRIYSKIDKMFYGEGDAIAMNHNKKDDLMFHTHPDAFGTWNKSSPPSEFDLYHSLVLGTRGHNIVNLVWDRCGVYIYYLYPKIVKQLIGNTSVEGNRERLINLLRYTKMGFGFFWENKDYKGHFKTSDPTSFSRYRNLLKTMGFYVDFKPYGKEIDFIIPR